MNEWTKRLKRFSVAGQCCQEVQLQVVAEPGMMVLVKCLICGRKGPVTYNYYDAVKKYRDHYNIEQPVIV